MKRLALLVASMMVLTTSLLAQDPNDSTVTLFDDLTIPLVERKYVANTNFQDNWFMGFYGGVAANWGSDMSHAPFFKTMGPAFMFAASKDITPMSGVRFQLNYVRNTGVTDNKFGTDEYKELNHDRYHWNSVGVSVDYLLNFTDLICGFRERRKFHLQGIVGIGGSVSRNYTTERYVEAIKKITGDDDPNSHSKQLLNKDKYDDRRHTLVCLRAGLAGTFMVGRNWKIHLETVGNLLDNSYDSNPTTDNTWDGHTDFLVGVSYRFNNKGGVAPGFYYPRHDMTEYRRRMMDIENLRDKTRRRRAELEAMTDTIDVEAQVIYTLIAFDEGDAAIDRLQQTNIYTTAYAWSKTPRSIIYITNSTAVDDKLFRQRAEAIRNVLLERYEIPASRIRIVASEKDIKPVGDYIELIVND